MNPAGEEFPTSGTTVLKTFVVVPCFNEAAVWIARLRAVLGANRLVLVFVDDGSADTTLQVLRNISEAAPRVTAVVPLARNSGKSEAIEPGSAMRSSTARSA